jgi:hypothetical protein
VRHAAAQQQNSEEAPKHSGDQYQRCSLHGGAAGE